MEQSLAKLRETLGKVKFELHQFKDMDVQTIKMAEEDFKVRSTPCYNTMAS